MQFLGCHSKQESSGKPSSQDNILLQKYDHLNKGEKKQMFINIRPPTDPPAKKKSLRLFFDASDAYRDATAQIWESFLPNNLPSPNAPAHSQIFTLLSHEKAVGNYVFLNPR